MERLAFRVVFVYFTLDSLPDLLNRLPGGPAILVPYWKTWNAVLLLLGRYVFHLPPSRDLRLPIAPITLGDFPGAYVLMLCSLLLSVAAAVVWTLADRRTKEHETLYYWLRVCVRYSLACSVLGFGISKLLGVQFAQLGLFDLMMPLGMLEPRGLLWAFMGFSRTYQVFTGAVECLGAILLFWRRTTLLGALLLTAAMANVLMIDIGYGMTVRRTAARLLLLAVFLTLADARRLIAFFVFGRPAAAASVAAPSWRRPWMRRLAMAAKATAVVYLLADQSIRMYGVSRQVSVRPSPALYGVYKVERLSRNGQEAAPGVLRSWELVVIDRAPGLLPSALVVRSSGETWQRYPADYDDAKQVVTISTGGRAKIPFTYARAGADAVVLKGMLDNQPSEISLRRVPAPRFLLTDPAAMHWSSIW